MKSNIKTAIILLLCALSIVTSAAAFRIGAEEKPAERSTAAMSYTQSEAAGYILSEADGYIAVFSADNTKEPITVTDIEVCTLNDNDRQMLQSGISAENKAELLSLLEDLSS